MFNFKRRKKQKFNNSRNLITAIDSKSPISEQYRTIRTNIQYSSIDQELKTILVTSSGPGEGKSTTTANLAVAFAQLGLKVLLVDADLRKPTVHHTFGVSNLYGFTSLLTRQITIEKAVTATNEKNLFIITSGPIPPNPSELLSSKNMTQFIQEARAEFDYIFFDSPPLLAVTDAQVIANQCDGSILVVSSGKTGMEPAKRAKELLVNAQGKLLGVVLNNKVIQKNDHYYYYGAK
ncbi:CpsD/CapB family tyrosine-protein kinase [Bacillus sp. ISL-75]|uniref:CpsD/CapB family tyrosine-protein kinase n=1 Tax=Bacillus sp. ISL-75 TaxID=2819137 RepID=UPI001BE86A45|nr:CpsD/CapB family tyrosine-protein kinase [Bacillus sp. ISL-75]MBT2729638.1 CpsD/CapB family tyrosine-protein kinase [Bacillus sp. ISL-75]